MIRPDRHHPIMDINSGCSKSKDFGSFTPDSSVIMVEMNSLDNMSNNLLYLLTL